MFLARARWFDVETSRYIYGFVGKYAQGNEPDHQMPYLYNYTKEYWKTAQTVRRIISLRFDDTPDGLPGNEDAGQMSAWYIFSCLGFYPICPGSGEYALGVPAVKEAIITLDRDKKLIIRMKGKYRQGKYVQQALFNGKPLKSPFITHEQLTGGGELLFIVGENPNPLWTR